MKIYVAGRTNDTRTVSNIAESLEAEGHEITFKWYDDKNPEAEIRVVNLESKDLEVVDIPSFRHSIVESDDWTIVVRHKPTGIDAGGAGSSKIAAHDVAINKLRAKLNLGWAEDPEKAQVLADREVAAVKSADAVVLVWAPDLLGAAMEAGSAIFDGTRTFIFRPGRDCVFYNRRNVSVHWSKTDLLEAIGAFVPPGLWTPEQVAEFAKSWSPVDRHDQGELESRKQHERLSADPLGAERKAREI
jgi:hypothetical protein